MSADIEASFHFDDNREPIDGYRPSHMIDGENLTTGVHHYNKRVNNSEELTGTIEFIAPEYYPKTLWVGKKIDMYDGSKKIGSVIVLNIFNYILEI